MSGEMKPNRGAGRSGEPEAAAVNGVDKDKWCATAL